MFNEFSGTTSLLLHCQTHSSHYSQIVSFLAGQLQLSEDQVTSHPDIHFLHPDQEEAEATALSIEEVRDLQSETALMPFSSERSIFILFKIDQASIPAQNALLKLLEEPPSHLKLILTTTRPQRILPTISSRCITLDLGSGNSHTSFADLSPIAVDNLERLSISEILALSEKYKERADAQELLTQMFLALHHQNTLQPTKVRSYQLGSILEALNLLEKNIQVRLVLEHCFFELAGRLSRQSK